MTQILLQNSFSMLWVGRYWCNDGSTMQNVTHQCRY